MSISTFTLIFWKKTATYDDSLNLISDADEESQFTSEEKFDIVAATATMNKNELEEYARSKGFFVEQINTRRNICRKANGGIG